MTRDEAIKIIEDQICHEFSSEICEAYVMAIRALRQPEIVRCKDCKWHPKSNPKHPDCNYCLRIIHGAIPPDYYCADGERKEITNDT